MEIRKTSLALMASVLLIGCATTDEQGQRLVTRPNMQFSRSAVYAYTSKVIPQLQPGLAVSPGAQPSTCTLCR